MNYNPETEPGFASKTWGIVLNHMDMSKPATGSLRKHPAEKPGEEKGKHQFIFN